MAKIIIDFNFNIFAMLLLLLLHLFIVESVASKAGDEIYQQQHKATIKPAHQFQVYVGKNVSLPCFANTKKQLSLNFYWLKWEGNDTQAISNTIAKDNFPELIKDKTRKQEEAIEIQNNKRERGGSTVNLLTTTTTTTTLKPITMFKMILEGLRYSRIPINPLVMNNNTLRFGMDMVIRNITKNDEGFYTCFVTDNVDSVHKTIFLKVDDKSKSKKPAFVTTIKGD